MACILHDNTQDLFKSMALQIELEKKEKIYLEQQLQKANDKLAQIYQTLAHKDNIISSLEIDLEHLINQLDKFTTCNLVEARPVNQNIVSTSCK